MEKRKKEEGIKEELKEKLREKLKDFKIKKGKEANLIYKVIINKDLKFEPGNPTNPKRGHYAFQTDLLITDINDIPLVVLEVKYNSFSTHDVLVYSAKAQKHKEIYPYLRYGLLIVGGKSKITNKFFTHNSGFDFAYTLDDLKNNNSMNELVKIVKKQINNAKLLLRIIKNKNETRKSFCTVIEVKE